jgi:hypothetical protein
MTRVPSEESDGVPVRVDDRFACIPCLPLPVTVFPGDREDGRHAMISPVITATLAVRPRRPRADTGWQVPSGQAGWPGRPAS